MSVLYQIVHEACLVQNW